MSPPDAAAEPQEIANLPRDELFLLELRIARRADELARGRAGERAEDFWQVAERELLPCDGETTSGPCSPVLASPGAPS